LRKGCITLCGVSRLGKESNFFLKLLRGFPQTCHPEERRISASSSAKIGDYDYRVSCGDPSFLRMTKMAKKICAFEKFNL